MYAYSVTQNLLLEDIITNTRWRVLKLIADGASDAEVACLFGSSKKAAQKRIQRLMRDLRLVKRSDLVTVYQACSTLMRILSSESFPPISLDGEPVPYDIWAALVKRMGDRKARAVVGCMAFTLMLPEPTRAMVLERVKEVISPSATEQPYVLSDRALDSTPIEAPTEASHAPTL